jgi:hypothetical protein
MSEDRPPQHLAVYAQLRLHYGMTDAEIDNELREYLCQTIADGAVHSDTLLATLMDNQAHRQALHQRTRHALLLARSPRRLLIHALPRRTRALIGCPHHRRSLGCVWHPWDL